MERRIIGRGLLAGALAGLFAFVYARVLIEPIISRAIDYESGREDAEAALTDTPGHDMELFTRDVQSWAGMGFGVLAFSVAMAGLFALAFVMVYPRAQGLSARMTALLLAGAAFVTVYLVPFLKYPANPPSIGHPDTIRERSGLYLLLILLSVALATGALWLGRRLVPKVGIWAASVAAVGGYVVATAAVMSVLPTIAETPQPLTDRNGTIIYPGFPADDLYAFRLYALGAQLLIWATIGVVFGALASRLLEGQRRQPITA
jgi:hypothetical protein